MPNQKIEIQGTRSYSKYTGYKNRDVKFMNYYKQYFVELVTCC
jgi:hypothetical protein